MYNDIQKERDIMSKTEKTFYEFIEELKYFEYQISYTDKVWDIIFQSEKNKWHRIKIIKYKETFYLYNIDGELPSIEIIPNKSIEKSENFGSRSSWYDMDTILKEWEALIIYAKKWFNLTMRDWVKYNKLAQLSYPLNRRTGIVPHSIIRKSLPDIMNISKEIGKIKTKKFIKLVEDGYFLNKENLNIDSLTANDYFNKYCKVAYIASARKDEFIDKNMSGRKMYEVFADGRHNGLLDINPNSAEEFANWIDGKHEKYSFGGHPWEIKRGGNTTHIDLSVYRPRYGIENKLSVIINGPAINRLSEAIKMFLAIYDTGIPIDISGAFGIRLRLLAQDNIGIVANYDSLHRANQGFSKEQNVYDVIYYDDLGRYKRRITPFITWEPIPVFKPR